mmetsp:Transcript_25496/g.64694  ORF Transcript_25496/g.64694 Transcript_25496/m.64694 type:complete len:387 (+) Transcript_25496:301-1461(+)
MQTRSRHTHGARQQLCARLWCAQGSTCYDPGGQHSSRRGSQVPAAGEERHGARHQGTGGGAERWRPQAVPRQVLWLHLSRATRRSQPSQGTCCPPCNPCHQPARFLECPISHPAPQPPSSYQLKAQEGQKPSRALTIPPPPPPRHEAPAGPRRSRRGAGHHRAGRRRGRTHLTRRSQGALLGAQAPRPGQRKGAQRARAGSSRRTRGPRPRSKTRASRGRWCRRGWRSRAWVWACARARGRSRRRGACRSPRRRPGTRTAAPFWTGTWSSGGRASRPSPPTRCSASASHGWPTPRAAWCASSRCSARTPGRRARPDARTRCTSSACAWRAPWGPWCPGRCGSRCRCGAQLTCRPPAARPPRRPRRCSRPTCTPRPPPGQRGVGPTG